MDHIELLLSNWINRIVNNDFKSEGGIFYSLFALVLSTVTFFRSEQIELETKVLFLLCAFANYHPYERDHRFVHLTCYKKISFFLFDTKTNVMSSSLLLLTLFSLSLGECGYLYSWLMKRRTFFWCYCDTAHITSHWLTHNQTIYFYLFGSEIRQNYNFNRDLKRNVNNLREMKLWLPMIIAIHSGDGQGTFYL